MFKGKIVGRILVNTSSDDSPLVYTVTCCQHGCVHKLEGGGNITRQSLLAWLQCSSEYADAAAHGMALANIPSPLSLPASLPDPPMPVAASAGLPPPAPPAEPRSSNKLQFGPFTVSRVKSEGMWIAWGANCNRHINEAFPNVRCKRQLTFGSRMPESEARVRMKQWLLAGWTIKPGPCAKDEHFNVCPLSFDVLEDEAELDRRAASLVLD